MKGFRKELILSILASHAFEEKTEEEGEQKKSIKRTKREKNGELKRRKEE